MGRESLQEERDEGTAPSSRQVFISYSRHDLGKATKLAKLLEKEGLTVWWDTHIDVTRKIHEEIDSALEGADCVLVLWSKAAQGSDWVFDEATYAREEQKVLSVTLDGTSPPRSFRSRVVLDLSKWSGGKDEHYLHLVDKLQSALKVTLREDLNKDIERARWRRRLAYLAGLAASLSTLALAFAFYQSQPRIEYTVLASAKDTGRDGVLADGQELCSGDGFRLEIDLLRRSHLYVFLEENSGLVSRLYPSELGGLENPTSGTVYIPNPAGENFVLDDAAGEEILHVYALPRPLPGIRAIDDFQNAAAAGEEGSKGVLRALQANAEDKGTLSRLTRHVQEHRERFRIEHRASEHAFCNESESTASL